MLRPLLILRLQLGAGASSLCQRRRHRSAAVLEDLRDAGDGLTAAMLFSGDVAVAYEILPRHRSLGQALEGALKEKSLPAQASKLLAALARSNRVAAHARPDDDGSQENEKDNPRGRDGLQLFRFLTALMAPPQRPDESLVGRICAPSGCEALLAALATLDALPSLAAAFCSASANAPPSLRFDFICEAAVAALCAADLMAFLRCEDSRDAATEGRAAAVQRTAFALTSLASLLELIQAQRTVVYTPPHDVETDESAQVLSAIALLGAATIAAAAGLRNDNPVFALLGAHAGSAACRALAALTEVDRRVVAPLLPRLLTVLLGVPGADSLPAASDGDVLLPVSSRNNASAQEGLLGALAKLLATAISAHGRARTLPDWVRTSGKLLFNGCVAIDRTDVLIQRCGIFIERFAIERYYCRNLLIVAPPL